jgi:hypothetical protein
LTKSYQSATREPTVYNKRVTMTSTADLILTEGIGVNPHNRAGMGHGVLVRRDPLPSAPSEQVRQVGAVLPR